MKRSLKLIALFVMAMPFLLFASDMWYDPVPAASVPASTSLSAGEAVDARTGTDGRSVVSVSVDARSRTWLLSGAISIKTTKPRGIVIIVR